MKFIKLAYVYELFNGVVKYEKEEGPDKDLKTALVFYEGVIYPKIGLDFVLIQGKDLSLYKSVKLNFDHLS